MASLLLNALMDLFVFCIFFAAGLFFRRKKEIHKRLMVLSMVSLVIPALARLPIPFSLIGWVIFAFSLTGVIYDVIVLRRVYFANIIGVLLINASTPLRFLIADTPAWRNFSEWITR
jgi:ethanolamine transporter EutH